MLTTSFPRHRGDYAGIFVFELARSLAQRGVEVVVVAPHGQGLKKREARERIAIRRFRYMWPSSYERVGYGGGVVSNIRHNVISLLGLPFFLVSFLVNSVRASRGADIIHAHWVGAGIIGVVVRRFTRARLVVTVHGSDAYLSTRNRLFRSISRYVLRRADGVITVAKQQRDIILGLGVNPRRVAVIPNGVSNAEELLRIPFADAANHSVVWIGRFTEEKNPRLAIQAFQAVLIHAPDARLTMIGDGPERAPCEALCRKLGIQKSVAFTGAVDKRDVPRQFARHALLMLTSNREGFPLVIIEALAAGRPVVATNVGGVSDIIQDGTAGFVVPPGTPEAIADSIVKLIADPSLRGQFGRHGRSVVQQECMWQNIAQRTYSVYREPSLAITKTTRFDLKSAGIVAVTAQNTFILDFFRKEFSNLECADSPTIPDIDFHIGYSLPLVGKTFQVKSKAFRATIAVRSTRENCFEIRCSVHPAYRLVRHIVALGAYSMVLMPFIYYTALQRGSLLLHAAAVAHDRKVSVFIASSRGGKTSTALNLVAHGWQFVADDALLVEPAGAVLSLSPRFVHIFSGTTRAVPSLSLSAGIRMVLICKSFIRWFAGAVMRQRLYLSTRIPIDRLMPAAQRIPTGNVNNIVVLSSEIGADFIKIDTRTLGQCVALVCRTIEYHDILCSTLLPYVDNRAIPLLKQRQEQLVRQLLSSFGGIVINPRTLRGSTRVLKEQVRV
ncbi:MAG: glycosyltransferase [Patescibacteria group bacterium]|nr:glycosyltransferase [Patescibacteria group bacterium]MDD5715956.1 glycosyltransferase [Patescibacteria group bacterium]